MVQENFADAAVLKQLRQARINPSLPFFSGDQTRNRLASIWPKNIFHFQVSKADAPIERTPVVLIEQRALQPPINMIGPKAKQRQEAQRTKIETIPKVLVPSEEAKKIYRKEDPERTIDSRPS